MICEMFINCILFLERMLRKNIVLFSVTNFCNARCKFCSFWKTKKVVFPKEEEIERIIMKIKYELNCGFLHITGGEPLTYPYIFKLIETANKQGMIVQLMTNGSLLNKERINMLEKAGLNFLGISFDHFDKQIFNKNRGLPSLEIIKRNMKYLKRSNIFVTAGITISKDNLNDLEKIVSYALKLGFDEAGFCLPLEKTDSSYKLGNKESDIVNISNEKMAEVIKNILKIKRKFAGRIYHQKQFLKDMLRYYSGKKQKFPCKGGKNIFYLDNNLVLYQCMKKSKKLGNIRSAINPFKNVKCYECPLQCFREPSIYYSGFKSLFPILQLIMSSRRYLKKMGYKIKPLQ